MTTLDLPTSYAVDRGRVSQRFSGQRDRETEIEIAFLAVAGILWAGRLKESLSATTTVRFHALYAAYRPACRSQEMEGQLRIPRTAILFQDLLGYCPVGVFSWEEATVAPAGVTW